MWERAFEARTLFGQEQFIERAATPEAAKARLLKQMSGIDIHIEVRGDLIIVTQPTTQFFAVYARPTNESQLILKRRSDTEDQALLAQAWQAANAKARELEWIP
jgi:hypothetical protein